MKRTKIYIDPDQAKKKVDRYSYWSIKDENGITICSNEENNPDGKSFADLLDKIIADNVDAEVQIKYGANEQSSRNNPPLFIKVNESIEWIEPEEETVTINGTPHKVDKNGNVNINFTSPEREVTEPRVEPAGIDQVKKQMEFQLEGIRKEYDLHRERMQMETETKLSEQMLKFERMLLNNKLQQLTEREQQIAQKEAELRDKETQIQENVTGYLKQIPNALGGLIKEWAKGNDSEGAGELAGTKEEEKSKPEKKRTPVSFTIKDEVKATELPKQLEVEEELQHQKFEFEPEDETDPEGSTIQDPEEDPDATDTQENLDENNQEKP